MVEADASGMERVAGQEQAMLGLGREVLALEESHALGERLLLGVI